MARLLNDLSGKKCGRWLVLGLASRRKDRTGRTAWKCRCECGVERTILAANLINGGSLSCGCLLREKRRDRRGIANPLWKGGKTKTNLGYIQVLCRETPSGSHSKYEFEHRKVMEKFLGRPLYKDETVHHKNGVRHDNRIENLELRAGQHGCGQTTTDLLDWAETILQRYRPECVISKMELIS